METKCFKVSQLFPIRLEKRSPKYRKGTKTKVKTKFYKSVVKWDKKAWEKTKGLAGKKGCYIYFWHNTPIYVGMTIAGKGYQNECFHPHKTGYTTKDGEGVLTNFLKKKKVQKLKTKKNSFCNSPLSLLFIYWDGSKNAIIDEIIKEMESYLIIKALEKNQNLLNYNKTTKKWSIPGFDGDADGDTNSKNLDKLLIKRN